MAKPNYGQQKRQKEIEKKRKKEEKWRRKHPSDPVPDEETPKKPPKEQHPA